MQRHNTFNRTAAAVEEWSGGEWTREGGVDDAPLVPNERHHAWLVGALHHPTSRIKAFARWNTPDGWAEPAGEAEAVPLTIGDLY